jgi:hypothetical protein
MGERFTFLEGKAVEQIWFWGEIRLVFELGERPEPGVYVDVQRCSYTDVGGVTVEVVGSVEPRRAGAVLELLRERVARAWAVEGVLRLQFDNGAELRALPDSDYESWAVVGDGGRVFQCMPGGEVNSW